MDRTFNDRNNSLNKDNDGRKKTKAVFYEADYKINIIKSLKSCLSDRNK